MRVVVMAKHPEPGRVKTRLATRLGPERACALYRAFIGDLADRLDATPFEIWWAYWPADAAFGTVVPGARTMPQRGRDLGERMFNASRAVLDDGDDAATVALIGVDAPHLPVERLLECAALLETRADVVLGPARDGGYYLLGLRRPHRDLFRDVRWGTEAVLSTTVARASGLGLSVELLPELGDVDTVEDLAELREAVAQAPVSLPRTQALLGDAEE